MVSETASGRERETEKEVRFRPLCSEPGGFTGNNRALADLQRTSADQPRVGFHRTGVPAAVQEVEGRSDHGAQQHVDVAPTPLGNRVVNVVLETDKQESSWFR